MSGACGKGPGEPPWTRDLAPRDPHNLVRLSSLDPDCPCTFPVAGVLPRSAPITVEPPRAQIHVNRLPPSDPYRHSLTVPYHTTLSAHHPNRTTTSVSIFVQPPPSQSSRYLHPALFNAQVAEARARATLPFPSLIGPAQGDLGLGRAPSSHRAIEQASRRAAPVLRLTCLFKYLQSPQPQILPPESLLHHTQTLRQQYYQARSAKPPLSPLCNATPL